MKYAQIRKMDITNGEGLGVSLFTQGCPYHCKNCFNPETWDFNSGKEWSEEQENMILKLLEPNYIKRFTILGGEPLLNRNKKPLERLLSKIRLLYPDKKIWMYTGGKYEELKEEFIDVLKNVDILIDGRYVDELKDYKLKWRGSSNQRIIDVQKSLKEGETILYE